MKVQNHMRKLAEEQKNLAQMRQQINDRFDLLNEVYMPLSMFTTEIKKFAPLSAVDVLKKKIDKCALQDKVVGMFDRLDRLQD